MKKLIILLPLCLLLLTACEVSRDWSVTVTTKTVQRSTHTGLKIAENTEIYNEVVLDMSEKEIKEYCQPTSYYEVYGSSRYEYYTSKTYVPL